MRRWKGTSDRSVLLSYHLRRRDDVSAWSRDVEIGHQKGSVHFHSFSGGSVSFKYQLDSLLCLKAVGLIKVPIVTSLRRVK